MLAHHAETLAFELTSGPTQDAFYRRGAIAAHLVATSGRSPRLIVAFPAGNTGAGLWFEALHEPASLVVERGLVPVQRDGELVGVSATLVCAAPELRLRRAVLGNVRALRRFTHGVEPPAALACHVDGGPPFTLHRRTLDGRRVVVNLEPHDGAVVRADGEHVVLRADARPLRLTVTALSDAPPLTPIPASEILRPDVLADSRTLSALAFLSYEEKLLAGSWRFLTYFGRDTLLTLELLMPVLRAEVVEAGLGAVIDRLSARGEVAHEEAVGEEAVVQNLAAGRDVEAPVLDHEMIDDDFLLAPVAAHYLLARAEPERARAFLARRTPSGEAYAHALGRNLALVMRGARPFVEAPSTATLIAIPEGRLTGDWRDSTQGLGHGRAPFSVNVALVPAALEAAAALLSSPLFGGDGATAAHARALAASFGEAEALFRVVVPEEEAKRRVDAYARSLDVDPAPAVRSITGDLRFPALSLDARGAPVPVMHSDEGLGLLFSRPAPDLLAEAARRMTRPFPAGLATPVGVVVANPALAPDPATQALFTARHYHGTVVWSWQQAMLAAGLSRQLAREDLPHAEREVVEDARRAVHEAMTATSEWRTAELWSFASRGGRWEHVPFGAADGDQTESNALQLWSTVGLAAG